MKDLWKLLSIIFFAFGLFACGGGSGGGGASSVTYSITGTTLAGTKIGLSGASTSSTTADGSGKYGFSGLPNGSYTLTPTLSGYSFSPTNTTIRVADADYPRVDFTAVPGAGTRGVAFLLAPTGAPTFMTDTHFINGVPFPGGAITNPIYLNGKTFGWIDTSTNAGLILSYYSPLGQDGLKHDVLDMSFGLGSPADMALTYEATCSIGSAFWSNLQKYFPSCSTSYYSITFDKVAGTIVFPFTTIRNQVSTNSISVSGSLTFPPF